MGNDLVICKRTEVPGGVSLPCAGDHYWHMARLTVGTASFANAMVRVCASYSDLGRLLGPAAPPRALRLLADLQAIDVQLEAALRALQRQATRQSTT